MNYNRVILLIFIIAAALVLCSCGKEDGPVSSEAALTETAPETEGKPEAYTKTLTVDVRPVPLKAVISDKGEDSADASLLSPSSGEFDGVLEAFGFAVGEGGLPVVFNDDPALAEEEYRLTVTRNGVSVASSGESGTFAAISTLAQLRCDGRLAAAEIEDKPATPYRGVIEGFYGTAWTHGFRLDLFAFMGRYKLNTYIYAPKDDPKHRAQWRDTYTGKELEKLKELTDCAAANNVRFVYAISPGLDIDLGKSYEKDFKRLCRKCESVYDLGVRDFAILLDDISTLDAKGHAMLLNDFRDRFVKTHEGCRDLIMITPEFCSAMLTGYTNELAPLIGGGIMPMWTGKSVVPPSITAKELKSVNRKYGSNVFIWWNYPVNDTMADELFMGPCENLDKELCTVISGLVSNPMNQGYASEVPLITIADYLWNPAAYDPEQSLRAAVKLVAPECADGLYALADLTRNSAINGGRSSLSLADRIKAYNGKKDGAAKDLLDALEKTANDLFLLSEKCDEKLLAEIKPWLDKAKAYVDSAAAFVRFDQSEDENVRGGQALSFVKSYLSVKNSGATVSPDVLMPFVVFAKSRINAAVYGNGQSSSDRTARTNLNMYQDYAPSNAVDGDEDTFFWSAGAPSAGSTFTVDLGASTEISGVRLLMGTDSHSGDFVQSGVVEYSEDGKVYTKLCDTTGRLTQSDLSFSARYVRLRCTKGQTNWLIITEFRITADAELPDGAVFDGSPDTDLSPLFDGDLFSVFSPKPSEVAGKTLSIDVSDKTRAELFLVVTDGVTVRMERADGSAEEIPLSQYTAADVSDAVRLLIVFGDGRAEIAGVSVK